MPVRPGLDAQVNLRVADGTRCGCPLHRGDPDAMGWEGGRLQDGFGIAGASGFGLYRFLRHERALGDMMAARLTLGGGPA